MKAAILAEIKEALAIAARVHRKDRARFKPLFALINYAVKQRKRPEHISWALRAISYKEQSSPVRDVPEYFQGTLRKIEEEEAAKQIRSSGPSSLGNIINEAMRRAKRRAKRSS